MPQATYPVLDVGKETGFPPSNLRISGRNIAVVGAIIEGTQASFDNGVLTGKAKVEQGIKFGAEALRAMKGRRVLALWLAAAYNEAGVAGWFGLTVGEMRIDGATNEGFKDVAAFATKLTDASQGRVAIWQMKDDEKKALVSLLQQKPDLWRNAGKNFRSTVLSAVPAAAEADAAAAAADPSAPPPIAPISLGSEGGSAPRTLRASGREITIVGAVVDGKAAYWDNGLLDRQSKVEKGITFGPESLRAMGGRRVCGVWIAIAAQDDGKQGFFGATVGEMRVDENKREGFKDIAAHGVKLNDAARGRIEVWHMKPEERQALGDLLRQQGDLWESSFENVRSAFA